MIKLQIKEFAGVKLKMGKKKDGNLYVDFSPIIHHANKLIKQKLKEYEKKKAFQDVIIGSEFYR